MSVRLSDLYKKIYLYSYLMLSFKHLSILLYISFIVLNKNKIYCFATRQILSSLQYSEMKFFVWPLRSPKHMKFSIFWNYLVCCRPFLCPFLSPHIQSPCILWVKSQVQYCLYKPVEVNCENSFNFIYLNKCHLQVQINSNFLFTRFKDKIYTFQI